MQIGLEMEIGQEAKHLVICFKLMDAQEDGAAKDLAKLSTEAEYVALSASCQEAIWLRMLLGDI